MKRMISICTTLAVLSTTLLVAEPESTKATTDPEKISPWDKSDGQWITISGSVTKAGVRAFLLDYGKGAITVELDDYDRQLEGFHIKSGDQVFVTGRVDADKGEKRSIEAASVYVKNIKKTFFASADDEEEALKKLRKATVNGTGVLVSGKIVTTAKKFMTIDTGYQVLDVSTEVIEENPFDSEGFLRLRKGDTVTIYGAITDGFLDSSKLIASRIQKN